MASSSVSQESLDMEDFDTMARRNRIRTHRGRAMPHRSGEREGGGDFHDRDGRERDHQNGDTGDGALHAGGDHESPTRSAAARIKDKQRSRANHLHKGKLPKDKRKLREKRRSTGVVHLPSTESTGDSLDDDDDDEDGLNHETKKNTTYNEGNPSHSHSHSHSHLHHSHHHAFEGRQNFSTRGNKSPSDLEADLEDNQDYDSTVSHSETNLTLIGRSESSDTQMSSGLLPRSSASSHSKFSPESSRASSAYRYGSSSQATAGGSEGDSNRGLPSSVGGPKSTVSSLVSRYTHSRDQEPSSYQRDSELPSSRDAPPSASASSTRGLSYGAPKDSGVGRTERSYGSYLSSRFQDKERESSGSSGASGSYHSSRFAFQAPRPFLSQNNTAATDNTAQIERQLEKEKEENKKLQQQIEQKDRRIAELERQVAMLNKECDELDEDNLKLQEENKALIRAMQQLSSNV